MSCCSGTGVATGAAPVAPPRVAAQMYLAAVQPGAWAAARRSSRRRICGDGTRGVHRRAGLVEFVCHPEQTSATSAALAAHHLRLVAAYADGPLHDSGADATIARILERAARARDHGVLTIVMNPDVRRDAAEKTDDELAAQARNLDRLGGELQRMGLALAVHAHDKEMRSGAREWYYNLGHTDPAKVGICLDVHWLYRGGRDPLPMLRAAGGRIRDVHLRNSRDGVWEEDLGPGDLDYAVIARALREAKFSGTDTVGTRLRAADRAHSLQEDLRRSRAFVRRTSGCRTQSASHQSPVTSHQSPVDRLGISYQSAVSNQRYRLGVLGRRDSPGISVFERAPATEPGHVDRLTGMCGGIEGGGTPVGCAGDRSVRRARGAVEGAGIRGSAPPRVRV